MFAEHLGPAEQRLEILRFTKPAIWPPLYLNCDPIFAGTETLIQT